MTIHAVAREAALIFHDLHMASLDSAPTAWVVKVAAGPYVTYLSKSQKKEKQ